MISDIIIINTFLLKQEKPQTLQIFPYAICNLFNIEPRLPKHPNKHRHFLRLLPLELNSH